MIGCFIALILVVYAIYNIFTLDNFISNVKGERLPSTEAILLIFTYIWFFVNIFLKSGPIALIILIIIVILTQQYKKIYYYLFFILLFIGVIGITINNSIIKFNIWKYLFNLIS